MFVACGIRCLADVSSICPLSDEGLMLETSAKHHIPQATKHTISTFVDQTHISHIVILTLKDATKTLPIILHKTM